jgi:hypothetical protein
MLRIGRFFDTVGTWRVSGCSLLWIGNPLILVLSIRILSQHAPCPTSNCTQDSKSLTSCVGKVHGNNLFTLGCVIDVSQAIVPPWCQSCDIVRLVSVLVSRSTRISSLNTILDILQEELFTPSTTGTHFFLLFLRLYHLVPPTHCLQNLSKVSLSARREISSQAQKTVSIETHKNSQRDHPHDIRSRIRKRAPQQIGKRSRTIIHDSQVISTPWKWGM